MLDFRDYKLKSFSLSDTLVFKRVVLFMTEYRRKILIGLRKGRKGWPGKKLKLLFSSTVTRAFDDC